MIGKRISAALLAALLLCGSLTACATSDDGPDETETSTMAETTAETILQDDLPADLNYGGDEITIISRDYEGWTRGEISVSGLNSDPVNDSIYERNKAVEQRLNIKINSILDDNGDANAVVNKVATAVKAGTNEYDLAATACYTTLPEVQNGTYVDLRSTRYLDFDKCWWTQGFNDVMEYADAQYVVTGDALISTYRFAFVTVFNQDLFTDARQPFLYEYVEDGTWTLDKQISLVPLFYRDNGNGIQDDQGDVYGFASGGMASIDAYWSSCQLDIIRKDADGVYEVVLDMDRLHGASEKILSLFHGTDGASRIFVPHGIGAEHDDIRELFAAGYSAMATLRIIELERSSMRNMAQKFGVVPMPKYDESQADYYTLLQDQLTVFTIPTTVTGDRLDEVSAVLEAMASTSYRIVRPAYYETTLRTKIAQDPQSSEMMELIISSIHIDAGVVFSHNMNSFHKIFQTLIKSKQNNTLSLAKAYSAAAKKKLTSLVNRLDQLSD